MQHRHDIFTINFLLFGYRDIYDIRRIRESVMEPWSATAQREAVLKISQVKNVFKEEIKKEQTL